MLRRGFPFSNTAMGGTSPHRKFFTAPTRPNLDRRVSALFDRAPSGVRAPDAASAQLHGMGDLPLGSVNELLPLCLTDRKSDPVIEDMMSQIAADLVESRGSLENLEDAENDPRGGMFPHNTMRVLTTTMEPVLDPSMPRTQLSNNVGAAVNALQTVRNSRIRDDGEDEEPPTLFEAVMKGDHSAAEYHLDNGNAWDLLEERSLEDGRNLIHVAAAHGQAGILTLFAQRVTRQLMNAPDVRGFTPLLHAVKAGHWSATKVLLQQGAKPERKGDDDMNAFDTAVAKKHFALVGLLAENGAYLDPKRAYDPMVAEAIHLAATMRTRKTVGRDDIPDHRILSCLMDGGCSIDAKNDHGNTALHLAAATGHHDMLVALLKEGAKTDVRNNKGQTPLHMIADKTNSRMLLDKVTTLVSFGAPLDSKDENDWTPLHVLLRRDLGVSGQQNVIQCIEELISAGAPMHAQTNQGQTPLDFANAHPNHLKNKAKLVAVVEASTEGTMLVF